MIPHLKTVTYLSFFQLFQVKSTPILVMSSTATVCFKALLALAIQWHIVSHSVGALQETDILKPQCNSDDFRSNFVLTTEDKVLQGGVMKVVRADSVLSCSQMCLREKLCLSTNFYSKRLTELNCELNNIRLSVDTKISKLVPMDSSFYCELQSFMVRPNVIIFDLRGRKRNY